MISIGWYVTLVQIKATVGVTFRNIHSQSNSSYFLGEHKLSMSAGASTGGVRESALSIYKQLAMTHLLQLVHK